MFSTDADLAHWRQLADSLQRSRTRLEQAVQDVQRLERDSLARTQRTVDEMK